MATISASVKGTFAATGTSSTITGDYITIKMDFAGTASVDVEEQMPSGAWVKIDTPITTDYRKEYQSGAQSVLRLNCTAHTQDVEYAMFSVFDPKTVR